MTTTAVECPDGLPRRTSTLRSELTPSNVQITLDFEPEGPLALEFTDWFRIFGRSAVAVNTIRRLTPPEGWCTDPVAVEKAYVWMLDRGWGGVRGVE